MADLAAPLNRTAPAPPPLFDPVRVVERTAVAHAPFDHLSLDGLFDPAGYPGLIDALPDRRHFHELSHRDALRSDGTSTRLRLYLYPELLWRLPPAQRALWRPIARTLCSQALEQAFKRRFRDALEARFGKPAETVGLYPVPILLRDQPGYRIGIHADIPAKVMTVQVYLPRDAAQRHIGTIFHEGERGAAAERTTMMPFLPGTGYAFVVTDAKSWHSAARTAPEDGERVSMMVTYYLADDPATRWKWRARRAAMSLGIRPKG